MIDRPEVMDKRPRDDLMLMGFPQRGIETEPLGQAPDKLRYSVLERQYKI